MERCHFWERKEQEKKRKKRKTTSLNFRWDTHGTDGKHLAHSCERESFKFFFEEGIIQLYFQKKKRLINAAQTQPRAEWEGKKSECMQSVASA